MTMCEYGNLPKGKTNDQIKIENLEREAQGLRSANVRNSKKLEEGFNELCEALDRQTQRLIERDQKLSKAIDLLADVVATRELEREAYNLHNKIEEFINEQ